MRTLIVLLLGGWLIAACNSAGVSPEASLMADTTRYTTIQWQDTVVRFDTLDMGQQTSVVFHFRNTGHRPLFLVDVKASCGCTVADYTKGAILPGREGEVTGHFDTNRSHPGYVRKNIMVTANTGGGTRHTLIFEGVIREKKS